MAGRGRRKGSGAKALREDPATTTPTTSVVSERVKTAATVSPPTNNQIAPIAYQLWLDKGCPVGSDQEDWFRAEAMVMSAFVSKCEEASRPPSISRRRTLTESEMLGEFEWDGHWEVWEREWGGARWVWDLGRSALYSQPDHCCPRQDRPVARVAEKKRLGAA
jgi:hypothetical protein